MTGLQPVAGDALPINPIRVETALSRFPVHRLAKHGEIAIDIRERNANGEVSIRWEVTHNSKYRQPGPLAYKVDTLLINRRIEAAPRPIPKIIRLGGLKEICRELCFAENGKNTSHIKNALYQNAFTAITVKTTYRQNDGKERTLEAGFHRYDVVFTGEELPNGSRADAVYIILSDTYMGVINGAMTRPLDYDYLKSLPAAPQRFYELISYQMYAAIKNDRERAKLLYSEFCKYAPLTRHVDWENARSQMAKIHAPHQKSGYIGKIDYEQTIDADGLPDWIMLYQPGLKARAEFRGFTKRGGPVMLEMEPFPADVMPSLPAVEPNPPLVAELIGHGVTDGIARQLVAEHDEDKIRHQIEIIGWLVEKKPDKIAEPGAYLVAAIRNGHATPKGFVSAADRQKKAAAKQTKDRTEADERRRKHESDAQERREKELINGFWEGLSKEDHAAHEAAAIELANDEERATLAGDRTMKNFMMTILRHGYARKLLQSQGKLPPAKA